MVSTRATARRAGLLYVLMSILAIFGYILYTPATFVVPGDAAATARKIIDGALTYRMAILATLAAQIVFIFLVLALYHLFRDVNRKQARLMVVLVCVGVAAEIVNLAHRTVPLVLLSDPDLLSVFTKPQLDTLAMGFIRWSDNLGQLVALFWGLWLLPFGILTIRSGFFPKILGVLQMVAGFAYVAGCLAWIAFPAHIEAVSRILMPLYFGEVPMVIWLIVMGAKVPRVEAEPSHVS